MLFLSLFLNLPDTADFASISKNRVRRTTYKLKKNEWERVVKRFDTTCKKAHDLDVTLLIDSEESWMQDAADDLVEEMMRKYNKEKAIVFNTLQLYRWDRLDYLRSFIESR